MGSARALTVPLKAPNISRMEEEGYFVAREDSLLRTRAPDIFLLLSVFLGKEAEGYSAVEGSSAYSGNS